MRRPPQVKSNNDSAAREADSHQDHVDAAVPRLRKVGFSLVELLVVTAILSILSGLLLPALAGAKEKAMIARVHGELAGLGLALEMYSQDNEGALPPTRINCNSDLARHWCEFPEELARSRYIPTSEKAGMKGCMEDPFNRGHTYKYAAPGPCLLNGSEGGLYKLWVPADFPHGKSQEGAYFNNSKASPIRWVIWSMGPKPQGERAQHVHAPLATDSWYKGRTQGGVLMRAATREGTQMRNP